MKISTHDGPTNRWSRPEEVSELVFFKDMQWGYAHVGGRPYSGITKCEASGGKCRDWVRITEHEKQPPRREVVASTGG